MILGIAKIHIIVPAFVSNLNIKLANETYIIVPRIYNIATVFTPQPIGRHKQHLSSASHPSLALS